MSFIKYIPIVSLWMIYSASLNLKLIEATTVAQKRIIGCTNKIRQNFPKMCPYILNIAGDDTLVDGILKEQTRDYTIYRKTQYTAKMEDWIRVKKAECNLIFAIILFKSNAGNLYYLPTRDTILQSKNSRNVYYVVILQTSKEIESALSTDRTIVIDHEGNAWGRTPPIYQPENTRKTFQFDCDNTTMVKYLYEFEYENCQNCEVGIYGYLMPTSNSIPAVDQLLATEFAKKLKLSVVKKALIKTTIGEAIASTPNSDETISYPYKIDRDVVAVPLAQQKLDKFALVRVFRLDLWLAVLGAYILTILTLRVLGKFLHEPKQYDRIEFVMLQTYAAFLSQAIVTPADRIIKNLFIAWVMFSLVILNAYNGIFFSFLIRPIYEPQIDSILSEQFFKQIKFFVVPGFKINYNLYGSDIPIDRFPKSIKIEYYSVNFANIKRVVEKRDTSVHIPSETVANQYNLQLINNKLNSFHKIPMGMKMFGMFVHNGRFTFLLSKFIHDANANGLIEKWFRDFAEKPDPNMMFNEGPKPLKIDHFILIFCIYFACIAIAFIAFVYEWFQSKHILH